MFSFVIPLLLCSFALCQWIETGFDSHFSKLSPSAPSKTEWKTNMNDQDFDLGSIVLTSKELVYPTYSSGEGGCIRKLSLEDGSPTGKYCFKSGDNPRAGLIPSSNPDSFVYLVKADSLHLLNLETMIASEWNFPDFSYYTNYVISGDSIVFAARGMCPDGGYEVCYNITSVTIGNTYSNFMIPNVFCSSEKCFLTVDADGTVFLRTDEQASPKIYRITHEGVTTIKELSDITTSRMTLPSTVSVSNAGDSKDQAYTIVRGDDQRYHVFTWSDGGMYWNVKLPYNTTNMEQGMCSDIIISPDGKTLNFICYLPQDEVYIPKNLFFKLDAITGEILTQTDFYNSTFPSLKCTDLLMLSDGKIIIWCTEVFGTVYYVVDDLGKKVYQQKVISKGQNFVPPVSDSSNNIYYPIAYFMADSFIYKDHIE